MGGIAGWILADVDKGRCSTNCFCEPRLAVKLSPLEAGFERTFWALLAAKRAGAADADAAAAAIV